MGVSSIDEQHRGIITLINMLIDNPDQPVYSKITAEVLREMVSYANNHLAYEESLLEEHGYPDYEAHRNHHLEYIKTVADFSMKALSTYNNNISSEFLDYLKNWWVNHILIEDMKYKSFFNANGIA